MQAEGMGCDFVGHPVVAETTPSSGDIERFRAELKIAPDEPLLLVLPGSRNGEVARMEPVFAASVARVQSARPDVKVVVVATSSVVAMLEERLKRWPVQPILLDPRSASARQSEARKNIAFAAADLALAASGTVSLELARARTPMVIAYKFNWLTTRIVKRKVNLASATLINLLTKTSAVPEFLFEDCVPEKIAPCVLSYLENEPARTAQIMAGDEAMGLLGASDDAPGLRAAQAVLRIIQ
jgi:lipid-A-disaccharide synthase